MDRENMIREIVEREWNAFTNAPNEGGKAACQQDPETFEIMRLSQYNTWPDELLASWLADIIAAEARGWNVMTEKYARMEESTQPLHYLQIKPLLPARSETHRMVTDQIVAIQVGWMEEFAAAYPKMAGRARFIHTDDDTPWTTSYETYQRAECGTYSDETLQKYGRFIVDLYRRGENLAMLIMGNTARLYGYADLDDAEANIQA